MNRPEWQKLMKTVRSGDVIIFDSVSRMARNADEGIAAYMDLLEKGVSLQFLKEPAINTETYKAALKDSVPMTGTAVDLILAGVNEYLRELARVQIRIAFEQSQKEVDDLRQRTREGIETARGEGKQIGQASGKKLHVKKADEAKTMILELYNVFGGKYDSDHTMHELEKRGVKVSRNTFFKYVRELKSEAGQK